MGSKEHFDKKDIQTYLKHDLLEKYLRNWSTKISNASHSKKIEKLNFVDGFAGQGFFNDGTSGSPKIAIENLFKLQSNLSEQYKSKIRFNIYTIEKFKEYFNELEELRKDSLYPNQIKNFYGEFDKNVNQLLNLTNKSPSLYFIDPFGYKGVNMKDVRKILSHQSHEVLINAMTYSIVRNSNIDSSQEDLYRFFDIEKIDKNISEYLKLTQSQSFESISDNNLNNFKKLEEEIIEFYKKQLKKDTQNQIYTLSRRIFSKINYKVYFHLVFATSNRAGLVEMKKAMVDFEKSKYSIEEKYLKNNNMENFSYIEDIFSEQTEYQTYDYSHFFEDFINNFNNKQTTYGQIIDYFLENSPLPFRDNLTKKSIYDYCIELFNSKYIYTSNRAFAAYNNANDLIIKSKVPKNFKLKNNEQSEQISLF